MLPPDINLIINKRKMKQKYYIIKLLLKIWFGILCISLLCTTGILWLRTQNIKPVPDMDVSYRGMALAWSILGILALSTGAITLFLNCFARVRNSILYSFLSFFFYSYFDDFIFWNNVLV